MDVFTQFIVQWGCILYSIADFRSPTLVLLGLRSVYIADFRKGANCTQQNSSCLLRMACVRSLYLESLACERGRLVWAQ
jgi:hypothetical protein